jgi:hypothetical protein
MVGRKCGRTGMNIDLKGVTFSIVLAALGVALVVLGAAQKISLAGASITIQDWPFRIVVLVAGVSLLAGAAIFQLLEVSRRSHPTTVEAGNTPSIVPATVPPSSAGFLTVDSPGIASFPASVVGAIRLQILARTVVNLTGQYGKTFEELALKGCEVEILIVDPFSESARHLYGNNYELYQRNAQTALTHLADLQSRYKDRIRIRVFPYVPTVSIMNIEKRDVADSFVQVQMYFIHGALGRDRPIFKIFRTDPWYGVFREEFDSIWKAFPDADIGALAATL